MYSILFRPLYSRIVKYFRFRPKYAKYKHLRKYAHFSRSRVNIHARVCVRVQA